VVAANAGIGVARAAYFPVLSISASLGRESLMRSNLFESPSRFWSVQPQGVLTLFYGGLHRAQSAAARAVYDEQVAQYRSTVLSAVQEVEDNLAALRELELESDSIQTAVMASERAGSKANLRLQAGASSYLEVVAADNAALAAHVALATIEARRLNASILLIRALGGDWMSPESGKSP
jgi:outer membrane protein TolC